MSTTHRTDTPLLIAKFAHRSFFSINLFVDDRCSTVSLLLISY